MLQLCYREPTFENMKLLCEIMMFDPGDRVDEIEDVLSPGWRERWQMDLSRALGDGHG